MTDQEQPDIEELEEQDDEIVPEPPTAAISSGITPVEPGWPSKVPPPDPPQT